MRISQLIHALTVELRAGDREIVLQTIIDRPTMLKHLCSGGKRFTVEAIGPLVIEQDSNCDALVQVRATRPLLWINEDEGAQC